LPVPGPNRAGLLATQGIRGQANRRVLERINESGGVFFARSDETWVLSGAAVHISFVAQDDGSDNERTLDGRPVTFINPDLTSGVDVTVARRLVENRGIGFMGDIKVGPFEISREFAIALIAAPNPDGRSNADVVRPWVNGSDVGGRPDGMSIIDFGLDMSEHEAALYQEPFQYASRVIRPFRLKVNASCCRERWWIHHNTRPAMRARLNTLRRYIVTVRHSKHRLFVWAAQGGIPDSALIAFAREDDYTLGILHSGVHELWARATGTQVREAVSGFRYTPTTTFETFPFPHPTDEQRERVGEAARRLVELRDGWLNPPDVDPAVLEKRTLTNLYNQRPTWLANAHEELDAAVLNAYGWSTAMPDAHVLGQLLALNLTRARDSVPADRL
jgi:hypothetical protein